ncbi:MAG: hypothetical protein AMXMBFR16_13190 [Candidatus Uhrbacteria bacterium]
MFDTIEAALLGLAIVTEKQNLRIVYDRTISAIARLKWIEQNSPCSLEFQDAPDRRLARSVTWARLSAESYEFSFTYSYATIPNIAEVTDYADCVVNAYQAMIDEYDVTLE